MKKPKIGIVRKLTEKEKQELLYKSVEKIKPFFNELEKWRQVSARRADMFIF